MEGCRAPGTPHLGTFSCEKGFPPAAEISLSGVPPSPGFIPSSRSPRYTCLPQAQPWFPFSSITPVSLQLLGTSLQVQSNPSTPRSRPGSASRKRHLLEVLHTDARPQTQPRRGSREPVSRSHHSLGKPLEGGRGSPLHPHPPAPATLVHSSPCLGNTGPCTKVHQDS